MYKIFPVCVCFIEKCLSLKPLSDTTANLQGPLMVYGAMRKVPLLVVEIVQIQLLACVRLETKPSQSYRELCMCDAVGGPACSFCDTQYLTCYKWCPLDWWSLSTWLDWEITWELLFWEDQGGCFCPQSGFTEEEGEGISDWINMEKGERKLSTRFPFPSLVSNPSRGE